MRRARPDEARSLSELALRSKAHWGYDPGFLEACRAELSVTPEFVNEGEVHVLEQDGQIAGFYSLTPWNSDLELGHFFVEPATMGRGVGKMLWDDAVQRACALGYDRLLVQSDPNAEGFYTRLGAERIGEVPSQALEGRTLPLLLFPLK